MARKRQSDVPAKGMIYYFDFVHDHPEIGGVVEFSKTLYRQLQAHYGGRLVSARAALRDLGFSGAGMAYLSRERRAAELLAMADPDSTFFFPNFQSPIARTPNGPGPRIINVIHDVQFAFLPELFGRKHLDWLHAAFAGTRANADHVVFISQTTKAQYIERFGEPRSHSVIYNPVAIDTQTAIEPGSRAPFLLTVAHRHDHKNFSGLLALFSELAGFRPDLELRIVGHGIDRIMSDLDALPASIRRRVHHHGFVRQDVRDALYRQASAFVTLSRFEGFNMAAAEAASHGTPLILSDLPVHRELHAGGACLLDLTSSSAEQAERTSAFLTACRGRTVEPWRHVVDCDPAVVARSYARVIDHYGTACRPLHPAWSGQRLAANRTESSFRTALAASTAIIALTGALALWPTLALAGGGDGGDAMPSFQGGAGGDGYQGEAGGDAETLGGGGEPGGGGGAAGGGPGGAGFYDGGDGGAGGTHGREIDSGSSDTLGSPGDLIGADGEAGQDVQDGSQFGAGGGGGGAGGYGVIVSGTGQLTSEDRSIAGGNGGDGGASSSTYYAGGAGGGDGGIGVFFPGADAHFTVTSETTVTGGDGGVGSDGVSGGYDEGDGGDGGAGGAGIQALDGGAIFIIEGGAVVAGGSGSAGGDGAARDTVDGADGVGGAGVSIGGNGSTLISAGSISGGIGGDGATHANAVEMTGDGNRLELREGYDFTGNVVASGNNNTLILGGTANSVFDASAVGAGAQYRGFTGFEKTGSSIWTLKGTGIQDWLINNGTLAGDTASFGGDLTFGTGAGARGVVFDQASNGTYSGTISGDGSVIKTGAGQLALNGANTYSGDTTVHNGTLVVSGSIDHPDSDLIVSELNGDGGLLSIEDGGTVTDRDGYIGHDSGSIGTATVTGASSTWANSDRLLVGFQGDGTLTIEDGGAAFSRIGAIGDSSSSTGTTIVTGTGSQWTNSEYLAVGNDGTGTLTIEAGGTVSNTFGYIGLNPDSEGMVVVTGAGSTWTNSADLIVGNSSIGTLSVADGGTVTTDGQGVIGYTARSAGTVIVTGTDSVWTQDGALQVGREGTGALTIEAGGAVSASQMTIAALAGGVGTLNIGAAAGNPATAAGTLDAASVTFGEGSGTINFNHTGTGYEFASSIAGNGTINQLAGVTSLTGDSSGFSGDTIVHGGTLIVAGSIAGSTVTINDGGTLGGSGTVGTTTVVSGATIAPGNSIGTLNVAGDVTFAAGSTYEVEVDPAGTDSDLIQASGTATLNGGSVIHIGMGGTYDPASTYTILTADGGVIGTFADVSSNFAFLDPTLTYDPDSVYLQLVRNDIDFCMAGMTANQCATGTGAESTGPGSEVYDAIVGLDEATARAAFDQLSGEIHASAKSALIEDSHFVRDAVNDRIRAAFGDMSAPSMPVMAYGEGGPRLASPDSFGPVAWGYAFGAWGSFDGNGNAAGMDTSTGGFLAGIDGEIVSNVRLGLLAGYSHSSFDVDDQASSGSSDNYHLGLYAGGKWDALRLTGGLAYTWHDIETNRSVAFPGFTDSLSGDYNAGTFQAFGEAGYRIDAGAVSFEPFANLAYVSLHTDGFTEKGGAAALTAASSSHDATFTTLGVHLSSAFNLGGMKATAHGTLGWRHAFDDTTPLSTHAFAAGDAFTIDGVPIAEDAAIIEAGLDINLTPDATLAIAYQGQIASQAQQHGFKANLSVRF